MNIIHNNSNPSQEPEKNLKKNSNGKIDSKSPLNSDLINEINRVLRLVDNPHSDDRFSVKAIEDAKAKQARLEAVTKANRDHKISEAKNLPPTEELQGEIQRLLKDPSLSLHPEHRDRLLKRGFTLEQIKEGNYRSVSPDTFERMHLFKTYSNILPYITEDGKGFICWGDAILCPYLDLDGNIAGYGLNYLDSVSLPKYHLPPNPRLSNGEMPLPVRNPKRSGIVYLCEGLFYKPHLASIHLDATVIGANSNQQGSSVEQLQKIKDTLDVKIFIIIPDAGSRRNPGLTGSQVTTIKSLEAMGVEILFLWWGQFDKTDGDIDEISPETLANAKKLTLKEYREAIDLKRWKEKAEVTPTHKVSYEYISTMPLESLNGRASLLTSDLGTGKTTYAKKLLMLLHGCDRVHFLTHRINLNNQLVEVFGGKLKHLKGMSLDEIENGAWTISCPDSILNYPQHLIDSTYFVFDEITSQIHHLITSSTLNGKRRQVDTRCLEIMRTCKGSLFLDGYVSKALVEFLVENSGNKQFRFTQNTFNAKKPTIYELMGGINSKGSLVLNSSTPWITQLIQDALEAPVIIGGDKKKDLRAIAVMLKKVGVIVLEVNADTRNGRNQQAFIKNPTRYLKNHPNTTVIYSPSLEAGFDINLPDAFKSAYFFFFGVIMTHSTKQMLMRYRDITCDRFVWFRTRSVVQNTGVTEYKLLRQMQDLITEMRSLGLTVSHEDLIDTHLSNMGESSPEFRKLYLDINQTKEIEQKYLRACGESGLDQAGYNVIQVSDRPIDPLLSKELKVTGRELEEEDILKIWASPRLFEGKKLPTNTLELQTEMKRVIVKERLLRRFPAIPFTVEFVRYIYLENRAIVERLSNRFFAQNLDIAKFLRQEKVINGSLLNDESWEYKPQHLINELHANSGIFAIAEYPDELTADHPLVLSLMENCNAKDFKRLTGLVPGKDALKFVSNYLQRMGYGGIKLATRTKINGSSHRTYAVQKHKGNGAKFDPMILEQFDRYYRPLLLKPSAFNSLDIF